MAKKSAGGFTKATAEEKRVFGSENQRHRKAGGSKSTNRPPSDAEVRAYKNLVRRYKRHSGKGLDYLPEEIRRRVEKKAPDLIPNVRMFKKMNPGERLNLFRQLEGYLKQKGVTKSGYEKVVDNRYKSWARKIPGLTKKQFDRIVKNGLFNDLKQIFDSDQIIEDLAAIIGNPNAKENAVEKYMQQMENLSKMESGKEAQKKYNEMKEEIRKGPSIGSRIVSFLKSLFGSGRGRKKPTFGTGKRRRKL